MLDLSSFKCGHDAPTYGLIDSIIKAGGGPYMALHDIDANKPAGSLKIRVETYQYTLARYEDELRDHAARLSELERRVAQKRQELLAARRVALEQASRRDVTARKERSEMQRAFNLYVDEDEKVFGIGELELAQAFPCNGPLHETVSDVAPLCRDDVRLAEHDFLHLSLPIVGSFETASCSTGCGTTCSSQIGGCCR